MPELSRQMNLAVLINGTGNHIGGWRLPEADVGPTDIDLMRRIACTAERGRFDMVFLADSLASTPGAAPTNSVRLEPLTTLAALACATTRIGLGATVSTTYSEPYNVARMLGTLDHISGGRVAWNVVTTADPACAQNFGLEQHAPSDERYERAGEFVEVAKALWDSWDDGAVLIDKESGAFVDWSKRREANHAGKYFAVKGPLNLPRSPQGYPVIIQAGSSKAGLPFAASIGEVVFSVQDGLEASRLFRETLKSTARAMGRDPDGIKVMPGLAALVVDSEEEGRAAVARLSSFVDDGAALSRLSSRLGIDVTSLPLDGPVPEIDPNTMRGYARTLLGAAKRLGLNLGQLKDYASMASGHHLVVGTAEKVADDMAEWFEAGAADGFMVLPAWFTGAFDRFVDEVVPILQRRGLFRTDYAGATLRDHLGLPRPSRSAAP